MNAYYKILLMIEPGKGLFKLLEAEDDVSAEVEYEALLDELNQQPWFSEVQYTELIKVPLQ